MKMQVTYITDDGRTFQSKTEAQTHEAMQVLTPAVADALDAYILSQQKNHPSWAARLRTMTVNWERFRRDWIAQRNNRAA